MERGVRTGVVFRTAGNPGHLDSRGSLVLSGPGVESGTVDAQVRQVDVTPTLLDLFGVEPGGGAVDGESLLPPDELEGRVAYTGIHN